MRKYILVCINKDLYMELRSSFLSEERRREAACCKRSPNASVTIGLKWPCFSLLHPAHDKRVYKWRRSNGYLRARRCTTRAPWWSRAYTAQNESKVCADASNQFKSCSPFRDAQLVCCAASVVVVRPRQRMSVDAAAAVSPVLT